MPPAAQRGLKAAGVRVLRNEVTTIKKDRGRTWIAGLDSQAPAPDGLGRAMMADLEATLAPTRVDTDPVILLAHEPDIFTAAHPRPFLTLSGHMHGGQVRLGRWVPGPLPSAYGTRYCYGHIREAGKDLVVSSDLGCSRLPVRMGVPAEIVLVEAMI